MRNPTKNSFLSTIMLCTSCSCADSWNSKPTYRSLLSSSTTTSLSSLTSSSSLSSRRLMLQGVITSVSVIPTMTLLSNTQPALASNLPTSTGADTSKVGTVEALIPIVSLRYSLGQIQSQLLSLASTNKSTTTTTSSAVVANNIQKIINNQSNNNNINMKIPTTEIEFKRIFDEYSDPVSYKQKFLDQNAFLVYYTKGFDGPGRANIEQDINERQTQQFGLRNEVWIAWENFLVELDFLMSNPDDDNDAIKYLNKALNALDMYLALVPNKKDIETAQTILGVSW